MFKEHQHDPLLDSPEQRTKDRGVMIFANDMDWCDVSDMWFMFLSPGVPRELNRGKALLREFL